KPTRRTPFSAAQRGTPTGVTYMATVEERVKTLNHKRAKAWEAAKAILDRANAEGRGTLSPEETIGYERANAEMTKYERQRDELIRSETAQQERELVNEEFARVSTASERQSASDRDGILADFFKRGSSTSAVNIDLRPAVNASNAYRAGARGEEFRLIA